MKRPYIRRESRAEIMARLAKETTSCNVSIPSALEFRREQYDLSATQFAKVLGLARSHYNEIINGKRRLPMDAMKKAHAIGVPANVLLAMEYKPHKSKVQP